MVAFLRVELAGSDDFGQLLHVGRFDVHYIKRLIRYLHMPKVNPGNKGKSFRLYYDKVLRQIEKIDQVQLVHVWRHLWLEPFAT